MLFKPLKTFCFLFSLLRPVHFQKDCIKIFPKACQLFLCSFHLVHCDAMFSGGLFAKGEDNGAQGGAVVWPGQGWGLTIVQ